jgi:hypothetical protein
MDDEPYPYEVVVTVPMPTRNGAEALRFALEREYAECPEVTVVVRELATAINRKEEEA